MLFKGTQKRNYQQISRDIDRRGGFLNAYTDRELTAYYTEISARHLTTGLEVLADMLRQSNLPPAELETERNVILEEMLMIADSPEDYVFDLFFETAFGPDSNLGRPIIGAKANIRSCSRDTLFDFYQKHYQPANFVISLSGALYQNATDLANLKATIEELFSTPMEGSAHSSPYQNIVPQPSYGGQVEHMEKETEQIQFVLGLPGCSRNGFQPEYSIFNQFLGGASSSRLFLKLREESGLCYGIASAEERFAAEGIFLIHGSTATKNFLPAMDLVMQTIYESVNDENLLSEIYDAKEGLISSMDMLLESSRFRAGYLAKNLLYTGQPGSFTELEESLASCSPEQVQQKMKQSWTSQSFSFQSIGNMSSNELKKQIGVRYPAAIF